jgi:phage/plasmid-like protein (TIGR03299 family)
MSTETLEWLNQNTLIGFTEKRGNAWHYKESAQGAEPNHYTGAIPVADVYRRLLNWQAVEAPAFVGIPTADGFNYVLQADRKFIVRSDDSTVLGIFKDGYQIHQYGEWLIDAVANIVDDNNLAIGQAGLLKQGAVAWVSVELPENIETPSGFTVRPQLLATTSHNGSLATTHKMTNTVVVCDNTLTMGLNDGKVAHRTRHSKHSQFKIQNVRDAIGIVHTMTDNIMAEIEALSAVTVTDKQFADIVNRLVPIAEIGETTNSARTKMGNKQDAIKALYLHNPMVAPWKGTKLGVIQAFNTYQHHVSGSDDKRAQRNLTNAVMGKTDDADLEVIKAIDLVLANA